MWDFQSTDIKPLDKKETEMNNYKGKRKLSDVTRTRFLHLKIKNKQTRFNFWLINPIEECY